MDSKKLSKKEKQRIQRTAVGTSSGSTPFFTSYQLNLVGLLIAVISFVLYANTLGHHYALDDYSMILENRITQKGLDGIPEAISNSYRYGYYMTSDGLYRPVVRMMFSAEWEWGGGKPALGHWMNVLIYAFTGFMLFKVLIRMTRGNLFLAFIAALLFACHPIHTEVVANIKSRDELLAFLFCILTIDRYLAWLDKPIISKAVWSGLFMFLALGSKESAITFLAILPLTGWFFCNDIKFSQLMKGLLPVISATVVFIMIRADVLGGVNTLGKPSVADNLLMAANDKVEWFCTAVSILGLYLQKLILPHPLVFDYSFNQIPLANVTDFSFLISGLIYSGMFVFAILRLKNKDPFAFCILFFLLSMSVSSNLFTTTGTSFGERLLYTPSMAFCLALAFAISKIICQDRNTIPNGKQLSKAVMIVLPLILLGGGKTIAQNPVWKDNFSLYTAGVEISPNSTRTHYYLGNYLVKKEAWEGKVPEEKNRILRNAIGHLKKSIEIYDKFSDAHLQMGVAYFNLGVNDSAKACYERALAISPRNHTILNNLGTIYFIAQNYNKALNLFQQAVEIDPNYADGQSNLGSTYGVLQQYDNALKHLLIAASLDPQNAQIYFFLGTTYNFKGDRKNAEFYFEKAYAINPALRPRS
jgi:Tfp pilus assembly protein PilF